MKLDIELRSLYDDPPCDDVWQDYYYWIEQKYLVTYMFLNERLENPEYNISHLEMPSFGSHVKFIDEKPYKGWWLIYADILYKTVVGSVYITHINEIGIYVRKKFRQRGIASQVLKMIEDAHKGETLVAHVNNLNGPSKELFGKHEYRVESVTPGVVGTYNTFVTFTKEIPPLQTETGEERSS